MLTEWKNKFPKSFEADPYVLHETLQSQMYLSNVLKAVEDAGLLNEETISVLLRPELQESMHDLAELSLTSADNIRFLLSIKDPVSAIRFIKRAQAESVDFELIKQFLSQNVSMDGLSRAITLFDLSRLPYCQDNAKVFSILTIVLANPLCQTIFDARLRCFSDYAQRYEPVSESLAKNIINELKIIKEEDRIPAFFDCFAKLRPFPDSQKYLIEVDVEYEVTKPVAAFCVSQINAIETPEDYQKTRQMIKALKKTGGDKAMFDRIKYSAASAIEAQDFASTREYSELMTEIEQVLFKPLINLSDYTEQLESSKGYQQIASQAIRALSPIMITPIVDEGSKKRKLTMM